MTSTRFNSLTHAHLVVAEEFESRLAGKHHVVFYEPVMIRQGRSPRNARLYLYGLGEIDFYDKGGHKKIGYGSHRHFMPPPTVLILLKDHWWEIVGGRAIWDKGGWCMEWRACDNSCWAHVLNAGWPEYQK